VTIRVKVITNPGRSFAAAFGLAVPHAGVESLRGCEVFQKQKTGRVVQVGNNKDIPQVGVLLLAHMLQGSGRYAPDREWHRGRNG